MVQICQRGKMMPLLYHLRLLYHTFSQRDATLSHLLSAFNGEQWAIFVRKVWAGVQTEWRHKGLLMHLHNSGRLSWSYLTCKHVKTTRFCSRVPGRVSVGDGLSLSGAPQFLLTSGEFFSCHGRVIPPAPSQHQHLGGFSMGWRTRWTLCSSG